MRVTVCRLGSVSDEVAGSGNGGHEANDIMRVTAGASSDEAMMSRKRKVRIILFAITLLIFHLFIFINNIAGGGKDSDDDGSSV